MCPYVFEQNFLFVFNLSLKTFFLPPIDFGLHLSLFSTDILHYVDIKGKVILNFLSSKTPLHIIFYIDA